MKFFLRLLRASWQYAEEHRWKMVLFYSMTVVANVVGMSKPYIVGRLINTLQTGSDQLLPTVSYWAALFVLATVVFWGLHGPSRIIERRVAFFIRRNFYRHYYTLLGKMPLGWHHDNHSGNLINRVNKAANALFSFADFQFIFIQSSIAFLVSCGVLLWLCWWLGLALLGAMAVGVIGLVLVDKWLMRETHLANEREHDFSAKLYDYLSNTASVISFNLQGRTAKNLWQSYDKIYPHQRLAIDINEYKWGAASVLIALLQGGVLVGYIWYNLHVNEGIMIGTLVMIYQYVTRIGDVLYELAAHYGQLVIQTAHLNAVEGIERDFERVAIEDAGKKELALTAGEIEYQDVSFAYRDNAALDHLNIKIKAGERIGLVGHSGAGKSTFVNLLMRAYEPQQGQILIDGQPITGCTQHSLREALSIIPQDTSLFESSILENIRFGRPEASDDEVYEAARLAYAEEFIQRLPEGYATLVGERGVKLSGGQRQRVAIARAILRNAPVLILDEATSALDTESEQYIQTSLLRLMEGKTVIAVAHRLSTLAHMDRILVLVQGRLMEMGSHDQLLKKPDGLYAKMWQMQSGGFIDE